MSEERTVKEWKRLEGRTKRQIAPQMRLLRECKREIKRLELEARKVIRDAKRKEKRKEREAAGPRRYCKGKAGSDYPCRNKVIWQDYCGIHDPTKASCKTKHCGNKALKGREHCQKHVPEAEWSFTLYDRNLPPKYWGVQAKKGELHDIRKRAQSDDN